TNPDGSHYSDPGVPYVSYFNGGDALHGFIRGGYGFPQSLGCVEMPYSEAAAGYPYTPIGTLVNLTELSRRRAISRGGESSWQMGMPFPEHISPASGAWLPAPREVLHRRARAA